MSLKCWLKIKVGQTSHEKSEKLNCPEWDDGKKTSKHIFQAHVVMNVFTHYLIIRNL